MLLDPVDQAAEHVEAEECPVTSVRPDSKPIVELGSQRPRKSPSAVNEGPTASTERLNRSSCYSIPGRTIPFS